MRVSSIVIFLVIVGGLAFVFIHEPTRDWVFNKAQQGAQLAQGYSAAKTPKEAMELFTKAIKARDYKAAAKYVSDDYAEELNKTHTAAAESGGKLDKIYNALQKKDFRTPMVVKLIHGMDPFPDTFRLKLDSVKETKKGETAVGQFEYDERKGDEGHDLTEAQYANRLDLKIFNVWPLVPMSFLEPVEIKMDKKSDSWKIQFTPKKEACQYFRDKYERYITGYDEFLADVIQGRKLREDVGPRLLTVLSESK